MWPVILVAVIALLVLGYLSLKRSVAADTLKARQFIEALKEVWPKSPLPTVSLSAAASGDRTVASVAEVAAGMKKLKFEPIGVYGISEMPGLEFYPMLHELKFSYALITRIVKQDIVYFEFNSIQDDGVIVELASMPFWWNAKPRPGKISKRVGSWTPEIAYMAFRKMLAGRTLQELTVEGFEKYFVAEWEAAYAHRVATGADSQAEQYPVT